MVQETINIIRQVEQEADQKEKDAVSECGNIIQAARDQATRLFEDITGQSKTKAKADLEVAHQKGDQIIAEQLQQAEDIATDLRQTAAQKQQEVINLIISQLY